MPLIALAAASSGCRYGSAASTAWPPTVVVPEVLLLWLTSAKPTTPTANNTMTTVVMIRPHGVCFWLTIDLPGFLVGGRAAAAAAPVGRAPDAGLFAVEALIFAFDAGLLDGDAAGLRWAMSSSSPGEDTRHRVSDWYSGPGQFRPSGCERAAARPSARIRCGSAHYACQVTPADLSAAILRAVAACIEAGEFMG